MKTIYRRYWARFDDDEERGIILLRFQKELDLTPVYSDWREVTDTNHLNGFEDESLSRGGELVITDEHPMYNQLYTLLTPATKSSQ